MFQLSLIVLTAVSIGVSGYLIKIPTTAWQPLPVTVQKQEWVYNQKRLMPLFDNVCEDSTNAMIIQLANEFDKDLGNGNYLNPDIINALQNFKSVKGLLPKGEIFTEFDQNHLTELKLIFEVLYFAKDFETFYKAAAWARQNINCGLYIDAIYLAIFNRKDTDNLSIPPPYELLPNYFINKDAIIKSSLLLADEELFNSENVREEGNSYIIDAYYSNGPYQDNLESLSYFNEDIGLNSFYFFQKLNTFPWLNATVGFGPKYGEHIYHLMKQLSTRYNLERYSNGMPELEELNWSSLPIIPYDSMLIYSNGKDFMQRNLTMSTSSEELMFLQNIQDNIVTVTTRLRDKGYTKEEIINHLIDILVISNNSYQNVAYKLLGNDFTSEQRSPSVLTHYLTIMRDPIFWILNKKIVDLVDYALCSLPAYARNDLIFPGIEIVNVEVKKMLTSFEYYEFDATDALKISTIDTKFQVKIGQYRLNHKPFTIKLNISSLVKQKGFVKMFISPKFLPSELSQTKNFFYMFDCFEIDLKKGKNIITRSSDDINLSEDLTSLKIIKKQLVDAEFGINALPLKMLKSQTKFPVRLVLPKGSENGLPFHILVFVAPYIKPTTGGHISKIEYSTDTMLTPGYPLDLNIDMHTILDIPNTILKDIIITHKAETKATKEMGSMNEDSNSIWKNSEKEKPNEPLQPSVRPEFTMNKEPFDYKSKRGQYGKKDYSGKKNAYSPEKQDLNEIPEPFSTGDKNLSYEKMNINYTLNNTDDVTYKTVYEVDSAISEFASIIQDSQDTDKIGKTSRKEKPIRLLKLSARPDFTMKKEPFDYKSKRAQYGKKKDDYMAKREKYNKYKQNVPDISSEVTNTGMDIVNNTETTSENDLRVTLQSNDKTMYDIVSVENTHKSTTDNEIDESLQKHEYDSDSNNIIASRPKKRNPKVYDFIFKNPFDNNDSLDVKIYE